MVTFESFAKVCDAFGRVKPHSYDFFDTIQVFFYLFYFILFYFIYFFFVIKKYFQHS